LQDEICPIRFEEVILHGITIKKPILDCTQTEDGKCHGDHQIDHDNCIPWCPVCLGIGWLRQDLPIDHKRFGKLIDCPNKPIRELSWQGSGLDRADLELTWGGLKKTQDLTKIRYGLDAMMELGHGSIYLHGGPGTGKTTSSKILVLQALRAGKTARYYRQAEMIEWLRQSYDQEFGQVELDKRMDKLKKLKLLVVDELRPDNNTDFAIRSFSALLDSRHVTGIRYETMTIYCSNYTPEQVLDPYQADRIRDGRNWVIHAAGSSVRAIMGSE
jgi:DNA replication protein DnaC